MRDNTDRLLEAIEHPERFTDEELAVLFDDHDTRQLYDLLSKMSYTLAETPAPDVDAEWQRFASRHDLPRRRRRARIMPLPGRHAAAAVIAVVASLAVVAATIGVTYSWGGTDDVAADREAVQPGAATTEAVSAAQVAAPAVENAAPETVIFADESLGAVLSDICAYYGVSLSFESDTAMELRMYFKWDQSQSLRETVSQLNNFDQIDITINGDVLTVK